MKIRDRSFEFRISLLKNTKSLFGWGETRNIKNRGEKIDFTDVFAPGHQNSISPIREENRGELNSPLSCAGC